MIERCLKISGDNGKKILQVLKAIFSSKKKKATAEEFTVLALNFFEKI